MSMNYAQACEQLLHRRSGKELDRRKLCNKTYLVRDRGRSSISLELFKNTIVIWHDDGSVQLTSAGYQGRTTLDRFQRFLPNGFRVWSSSPFWFVSTPSGTRPFYDGMRLNCVGQDDDLPEGMNDRSAFTVGLNIRIFAKEYVARLTRGELERPDPMVQNGCPMCATLAYTGLHANTPIPRKALRGHLLKHIEGAATEAPSHFAEAVLRYYADGNGSWLVRAGTLARVIEACWPDSQKIRRQPRNKKQLVERTELMLLRHQPLDTSVNPHYWRRELRQAIENYLYDMLRLVKKQR